MRALKAFKRLRWQLMGSYLPLIAVPVLIVSMFTRSVAEQRVDRILVEGERAQGKMFTECLAGFYEARGSWDGVNALFAQTPFEVTYGAKAFAIQVTPPPSDSLINFNANCWQFMGWRRVTLASQAKKTDLGQPVLTSPINTPPDQFTGDAGTIAKSSEPAPRPPRGPIDNLPAGGILIVSTDGSVIASSNVDVLHVGTTVDSTLVADGLPIMVDDQRVGTVVFDAEMDAQRQQLLGAVNGSLALSGALSVVLAVGLGWELSRRITAPVNEMMQGVRRLATGAWSTPLRIHAPNEFGELTHAFNTMASEITRQTRMNKQMVADIAHDLRTPLSAMSLEIEAIEAGYQTPLEATESLREEITFLKRLVDDLRLLSLIDADQIKVQVAPVQLRDFLCALVDFWETIANEEQRTLSIDAPVDLPEVAIDAARMRQVLGNLIDNAIRHTKEGGQIVLGARAESSSVAIWVKDDGEGIAPDDLPFVFDRFYRANHARTQMQGGGSGLGLSIVQRLVTMHGGSIDVASQPGHGATFTIRLKRPHA